MNKKNSNKKNSKPIWIVVTGLDGAGKTSLVRNLATYYSSKKLHVHTAHLPFDVHLRKDVLPVLRSKYSDRLLFALDNYIFASKLEEWFKDKKYDVIITQRGFFDSFVHGAVQGYSYSFISELNRISELPICDIMIHLVASAEVAYHRIKNDPEADKFEYPTYIRKQEQETRNGYYALINENPDLSPFSSCKNTLIDTTSLTIEQVFGEAKKFLNSISDIA